MTMPAGEFGAVIVCDDIRREISNKDILIGVYGGDIVLPSFPMAMKIALFMEFWPNRAGDQMIFIKISAPGVPGAIAEVNLAIRERGWIPITLPNIHISVAGPGELRVDFSQDKEIWQTIKRKNILQGSVVSLPFPTARSSPSSNL